jgi:TRAP-type mannitol/chloroaromatic compound transport system permease large subunit
MALVLGFEPSGYGVGFDRRSQSKRIHITLAMLASLIDEEFSIVDDDTDKTLVTKNVATLRVRVSQFTIGEFAQATVLAFFVDFTEICDSCKRCKTFAEDCYI